MALKKYKPITAGTRWRIGNAYAELLPTNLKKAFSKEQRLRVAVTPRGAGLCATSVVVIRRCTV